MSTVTRRQLLVMAGGAAALALPACGKKLPSSCTDTTGLSPDELQARSALAYVDATTQPGKTCETCQQYVGPKTEGACGSCKVLKGPVHPNGNCKVFVLRA